MDLPLLKNDITTIFYRYDACVHKAQPWIRRSTHYIKLMKQGLPKSSVLVGIDMTTPANSFQKDVLI
jgi:hypothetical protein